MANKGAPSKYTQELVDNICERISTSNKGLVHICKELNISTVTVYKWIDEKPEFANIYARAREAQADFLADEILAISDDGSNDFMTIVKGDKEYEVENKEVTNRSRLRVDARKWIASKLKPKKYGDKIDVTTQGDSINKAPTIIKLSNGTEINLE